MSILLGNPIIRREAVPRRLRGMSPSLVLPGLAIVAIVSFMVGFAVPDWLALGLVWLWSLLAILLAPIYTSRSIASERERGTWDLLIVSRLTPAEIVFGKLLSPLLPLWAVGMAIIPMGLASVLGSSRPEINMSQLLISRLIAVVFTGTSLAAIGLYFSMRCSSAGSALLLTFGSAMVLYSAVPVFLILGGMLLAPGSTASLVWILSAVVNGIAFGTAGLVCVLDLIHRFDRLEAMHRGGRRRPAPPAEGGGAP
jgi:ABC-type transport system involved in multi-copper enzyme maturation permease subunit